MFTVFCDGHLLFDLKKHIVLTNPRLTVADNSAGSLEFDIDPKHPMYDKIESMVSEIVVKEDGKEIWAGRATEQKTNFFGMKSVYCEGELAYLCDTIQPQSESQYTDDDNVARWLNDRLVVHNEKAPADKQFRLGVVTVREPDMLYRYTNYEDTLGCIKDKLLDRLGGHLRIRKENGVRYLDYLADYPGSAQQSIRFGLNLLEYSRTLTRADIATVCVPLGARLEEKDFPVLDKYLDVSSVNGGSIYVESKAGVEAFGRIIKVVHWDDVATPQNLLTRAKDWLANLQYDDLRLEVNALDFHLADNAVPAIRLLDQVRVVSPPHGLDAWFPVTQLEIPLDNPAGMVFTLGKSERVSLTTKTNNALSSINDDLETMPSSVLLQAKNNATELIKSGALGGHVVVLPDELYVTDSEDIGSAQRMWRWNLAGLGYSKDGGKNYGTAITMDGRIVADYITAGTMSADRIKGGTIKLGGTAYGSGKMTVYNATGTEIGHWDSSGISVKAGSITGGAINGASITVGGSNNTSGSITVKDATGKKTIGKWDNTGIDVTSGSINGASITVGGTNNASGSITVKNASGTTIGTWNNSGITVKAGTISGGTISGAKITVGGKDDGAGTLTVNGDDGKAAVALNKSGITVKKGTITGTTIDGNTISGGTIDGTKITGGTLTLGGKRSGSLIVQDAKGNEIGKWNSSGIDVKAGKITGGSISGAKLTVGGKNDADGTITVKGADGKQAVKLDKSGITVSKGTIKGATIDGNTITGGTISGSKISGNTISGGSVSGSHISVGGKDNKTGWIKVYDKDNKTVNITLGQNGITVNKGSIKGTTISLGNKSNGDGSLTVKDANGSTVGTFDQNGITIKKGSIKIGSNFEVTTAGTLTAKNGTFKGTVDSGKIQSSTITGSSMTIGDKFKITKAGVLVSGIQDDFGTWIQLKDGIMTGGYGRSSDKYGTIEFTAESRDTHILDTYYHGIQLTAELFRISAKYIAVTSGTSKSGTARAGYDGTISVVTKITDNGNGTISWDTGSIVFRHGLAVV